MAVVKEGIRAEENNTLSFGDFLVKAKLKVSDFEFNGDIYKVKTHDELTRLEKNGKLLIETVPGAACFNFNLNEQFLSFSAEGFEDTQITLELEPEKEYRLIIDNVSIGEMRSKVSGKISFSVELGNGVKNVKVEPVL